MAKNTDTISDNSDRPVSITFLLQPCWHHRSGRRRNHNTILREVIIPGADDNDSCCTDLLYFQLQALASAGKGMHHRSTAACRIPDMVGSGFLHVPGRDGIRMRNDMVFNISGVFPIACAILDGLAARASLIDEMTITAVRSARKIRRNRRK